MGVFVFLALRGACAEGCIFLCACVRFCALICGTHSLIHEVGGREKAWRKERTKEGPEEYRAVTVDYYRRIKQPATGACIQTQSGGMYISASA